MKKFIQQYRTALFIGLILFAAAAGFVLEKMYRSKTPVAYTHLPGKTYSVVLKDGAFSPSPLTISQNDIVVFTTTDSKAFWPASDPHPLHDLYPEFDPKHPIQPTTSWSFTFTKAGDWKYHDHLFPVTRGEIIVTPVSSKTEQIQKSDSAIEQCGGGNSNSEACFNAQISNALKSKNLDAAFEVLGNLYQTNTVFASNCHNASHELGELAYEKFSQHIDFQLSPESYYCGYGFYHGFMEALLHDTGSIQKAKEFCTYVGQHFTNSGTQAESACYHGIGHGAVDGEPKNYKTSEDFISPALALCEKLQGTHEQNKLCASGIYNALAIVWNTSPQSLPHSTTDPFEICKEQQNEAFAEGCYHQMNTVVFALAGGDFGKGIGFVEKIADSIFAEIAMDGFSTQWGNVVHDQKTYDQAIVACHKARQSLRNVCVTAFASGIVEGGPPGREYDLAIPFCNNALLTSAEKDVCFQRLTSMLSIWYPHEKVQEVCKTMPEAYQKYCAG